MLTRPEELTGKTIIAVIIQAVLFGLYHGIAIYAASATISGS